jgi:GNAT superfamily N-acetyltransferase
MTIEVWPAAPQRWADVAVVFIAAKGRDACWCQRFRRHDSADNQTALEIEIDASSVPIGLVAYVDGHPAGWCRVVPRHTLPGVVENSALRRLFEDDDHADDAAWWVSCFAVRRAYRGHGVGVALLRAAADFARERDAAVLDGHPVDVAGLTARPSPSALFTGTRTMFAAAGFEEIGRTFVTRPVMRKTLR